VSHYEARMTSKGQITVPAAVRDFFGLKAGDRVDFYIDEQTRSVEIVARNKPITELFGFLNEDVDLGAGPLTQDAIDGTISDHLAEDDARIARTWRSAQPSRRRRPDAAE
jgi:antitoxin PrlF